MPGLENIGRVIIVLGLVLVAMGLLLTFSGRIPFLGRLPGDIAIQGENFSCFFPVATMILLSVVLTVVVNLVLWLFQR